ncbi:tripartite tricarboxylate transporter substrate binding protein [Polaromonas sp. P1(28)-13]|nr:tripartite tricarboxylate transporter substrate binding protein [Polaromonas sp. P1(28)-13]
MKHFQSVVRATSVFMIAVLVAGSAAAQTGAYPVRPIKLTVPFSAGGSSDILGRVFADRVGAELGQAVIVDNRAGGNTVVGTQAVASSKPDGYSILQVTPNAVIVASLQQNLPYDMERDFTPVIGVGAVPLLLVVPAKSELRSVADLVNAAKTTPGGISYASGGVGSLGHLVPARFAHDLKMNATHVPYRGVAPALQDVIGGRVHFMFVSSIEGMQMVGPNGVRVLGVTAEQRHPSLPDVPTMAELGFAGFVPAVWYGFVVPKNTPAETVDRLYQAFAKAANDQGVREKLGRLGLTVRVRSAVDFGRLMRDEAQRWSRVVKENNIKME